MKKKMAFTALGLGAAYLMRNKDAREKLANQFNSFGSSPMRGEKTRTQTNSKKGLLGNLFN